MSKQDILERFEEAYKKGGIYLLIFLSYYASRRDGTFKRDPKDLVEEMKRFFDELGGNEELREYLARVIQLFLSVYEPLPNDNSHAHAHGHGHSEEDKPGNKEEPEIEPVEGAP